MSLKNAGQYAKALVAAASAVITALAPYYGDRRWFAAVTAGIGALLVYLVQNTPGGPQNPQVPPS